MSDRRTTHPGASGVTRTPDGQPADGGRTGTILAGRYLLGPLLGQGGMADVHRAVDTVTGEPVAVKLLRAPDPAAARRMAQEAKALGRLRHDGLVQLLDAGVGTGDGQAYLVMDLVEGQTLAGLLRDGPLGTERTAALAATVGGALAYVHAHGIVHRDVKPGNVLVNEAGDPRLADFGIASLADASSLTVTGTTLGTAAYMAPEQLEHHQVGPAADVWSLAMVLLECLLGRRVYEGSPVEVVARRLAGPVPLPADLPVPWRLLLAGMFDHDPSRRPSAAEVAAMAEGAAFAAPWQPAPETATAAAAGAAGAAAAAGAAGAAGAAAAAAAGAAGGAGAAQRSVDPTVALGGADPTVLAASPTATDPVATGSANEAGDATSPATRVYPPGALLPGAAPTIVDGHDLTALRDTGPVSAPAEPTSMRSRLHRWAPWLAALAAVAVVAIATALAVPASHRSASSGSTQRPATPTSTTSTPTSTTTTAPLGTAAAATALLGAIGSDTTSGALSAGQAAAIGNDVSAALVDIAAGNTVGAANNLDGADTVVAAAVANGSLSTTQAATLQADLSTLAASAGLPSPTTTTTTLPAAPPPAPVGGPGSGHGKKH
ncbi:MAG: serine/threonine-protein kinase [Actinomycetota bacterium]|nr:serine/threonine-protein kinase [Actinomycetota bacterium]